MTLDGDTPRVSVLVADDHALMRAGVRMVLTHQDGFEIAGEAPTVHVAEALCLRRRPDVLLLDLGMPGDALAAIGRLHVGLPRMGIVVFSTGDDVATARAALGAGAAAFIRKDAAHEELVAAVRTVAGGGRYLDPALGARLLETPGTADRDGLSPREREVLRLVALGYTNAEMAARLFLSVRTVEAHRAQLQQRLAVRTRHELVLHAIRRGLLTDDELA